MSIFKNGVKIAMGPARSDGKIYAVQGGSYVELQEVEPVIPEPWVEFLGDQSDSGDSGYELIYRQFFASYFQVETAADSLAITYECMVAYLDHPDPATPIHPEPTIHAPTETGEFHTIILSKGQSIRFAPGRYRLVSLKVDAVEIVTSDRFIDVIDDVPFGDFQWVNEQTGYDIVTGGVYNQPLRLEAGGVVELIYTRDAGQPTIINLTAGGEYTLPNGYYENVTVNGEAQFTNITIDNTYKPGVLMLNTANDFENIRTNLNGSFEVGQPINFADLGEGAHPPIGTRTSPFTGFFNGGNHYISGLDLYGEDDVGLFGSVSKVSVESEPTLQFVILDRPKVRGDNNVGALVGYVDGHAYFHDCHGLDVNVEGDESVGGLFGYAFKSNDTGAIRIDKRLSCIGAVYGSSYVGGLMGHYLHRRIFGDDIYAGEDFYTAGNVVATGGFAGGIAGLFSNGTSSASWNADRIHSKANVIANGATVGGLCGSSNGLVLGREMFATGSVIGNGANCGGLFGTCNWLNRGSAIGAEKYHYLGGVILGGASNVDVGYLIGQAQDVTRKTPTELFHVDTAEIVRGGINPVVVVDGTPVTQAELLTAQWWRDRGWDEAHWTLEDGNTLSTETYLTSCKLVNRLWCSITLISLSH